MPRTRALLTLAAALAVAACDDDAISPRTQQSRLEILPEHAHVAEFHLGDTIRLQGQRLSSAGAPLVDDTAVRFVWESSDTTVVMVDENGLAEIVGLGKATVRLRVGNKDNPDIASTTDTATAEVELGGSPVVHHEAGVVAAATNSSHECVVLNGGTAECRGQNGRSQLGIGEGPTVPSGTTEWTRVSGPSDFSTISVSIYGTCALAGGGRSFCWGTNDKAQLGLGHTTPADSGLPVGFGVGHQWLSIQTRGHSQVCGITAEQVPLCVGHNDMGQVGREPLSYADTVLGEFGSGHRMTVILTEDFLTCGLTTAGAVYCSGEGGPQTNSGGSSGTPTRIGGTVPFTSIAIGTRHGCGLVASGAAYCWGQNGAGQLGTGNRTASGTAQPVLGGQTFVRIYAFENTSCGVTAGLKTWCWGSNAGGALGRTRLADSPVPVPLGIEGGLWSIDRHGGLGSGRACAIDAQTRLVCWSKPAPTT